MNRRFAAKTMVPSERTLGQILRLLQEYGAEQVSHAIGPGWARLSFHLEGHAIRVALPLPQQDDRLYTTYQRGSRTYVRLSNQAYKLWEAACRQRWRALRLVLMAKLEAIDLGITTVEDEWLADIVTDSGQTVGDVIKPQLALLSQGKRPLLLLPAGAD